MSRAKIVAGNWKMNLDRESSVALARSVQNIDRDQESSEVLIFPATIWLAPVSAAIEGSFVRLGGQNCHSEPKGAFTGEVSAAMLAEICTDAMAGHSERRHVFGESDDLVSAKVRAILDAGMRVVLCVGETLAEREAGDAEAVVERQLRSALTMVPGSEINNVVIAYEPVWAIGTGVAATPADAQTMCQFVRQVLRDQHDEQGEDRPVLYGGSVTPDNARELFNQADIDGGLIGGASLDVQSFRAIVDASDRADKT
ncbi:MAG: triose-phosphate isomerase [Chloroflexia bacterium]|nr:triose-phosphate isomerase [Chloroflexia bacterium]